jgi:hypothetical protein
MEIKEEYRANAGTIIRLLHADGDNGSGMRRGTCPGCHNGMEGYSGDSAAMVELDDNEQHIEPRRYVSSTNWGHEPCVTKIYKDLVTALESDVDIELPWTASTQREMVLFLQENGSMEANYDRARPAASRYHFRRKVTE